jgi:hypothetical protein
MRIRFFESVTIDGERYEQRTDHDLPNDQANALVQSGVAVKCDESRFARPATAKRENDPVATPGILASIELGNVVDPALPLGSGNPPASRTTAVPPLPDEPEALPKARTARAR